MGRRGRHKGGEGRRGRHEEGEGERWRHEGGEGEMDMESRWWHGGASRWGEWGGAEVLCFRAEVLGFSAEGQG